MNEQDLNRDNENWSKFNWSNAELIQFISKSKMIQFIFNNLIEKGILNGGGLLDFRWINSVGRVLLLRVNSGRWRCGVRWRWGPPALRARHRVDAERRHLRLKHRLRRLPVRLRSSERRSGVRRRSSRRWIEPHLHLLEQLVWQVLVSHLQVGVDHQLGHGFVGTALHRTANAVHRRTCVIHTNKNVKSFWSFSRCHLIERLSW